MPHSSRFVAVSRRSFVRGSLGAGLLLAFPLTACGNDDASVFTEPPATTDASGTALTGSTRTSGTSVASGTAPRSTAPAVATPAPVATTAATAATTTRSGPQLHIDFTFAASAGDRINNPYIAVWIEDAGGALVRTVSVWFSERKSRYLDELRRWYTADNAGQTDGAIDTVSGGSRAPGTYTVTWDGTNATGSVVAAGDYFVCIEAAREHGPYELVRESVAIGATALTKQLQPSGELTAAAVQLVV